MSVKKVIGLFFVSILISTITIAGCISENAGDPYNKILKQPIFILDSCSTGGLLKDYKNETLFDFRITIENPNDIIIDLEIIYFIIIDELGNIIYSFEPIPNPELEMLQFSAEKFSINPNENISLYNDVTIFKLI